MRPTRMYILIPKNGTKLEPLFEGFQAFKIPALDRIAYMLFVDNKRASVLEERIKDLEKSGKVSVIKLMLIDEVAKEE